MAKQIAPLRERFVIRLKSDEGHVVVDAYEEVVHVQNAGLDAEVSELVAYTKVESIVAVAHVLVDVLGKDVQLLGGGPVDAGEETQIGRAHV